MHPWWFCLWLWEWFWQESGVLPWVELNQGSMSVAALIVALWLAIIEQRRAVRAEAQMKASDAAADRRALEASRDADRRMTEAAANADRKAVAAGKAADRKAAVAAIEAKLEITRQFVDAVVGLIDETTSAGLMDLELAAPLISHGNANARLPRNIRSVAPIAGAAMRALQPAAPPIPRVILATERAIQRIDTVKYLDGYGVPSSFDNTVRGVISSLEDEKRELLDLRPKAPGSAIGSIRRAAVRK